MKQALRAVDAAFSMFSAIPMPQMDWDKGGLRYMLWAFPLIGAVMGGLCTLWALAADALALPAVLRGAGLCLIPLAVTGGVHLDGFADTCDALASYAPPEKRRQILKDPHMGAFAAIRLCGWFLADFALWAALPEFPAVAVTLGFCLSRALSGLAVARWPLASDTGLVHTFAEASDRTATGRFLTVVALLLTVGLAACGVQGAAMAVAAYGVWLWYRRMARVQFGGISGDLAGWFVQTCEVWMLGALCAVQYLAAAWH